MIVEINNQDTLLIKQLEESFPNYFSNTKVLDDMNKNIFSKYFIYRENSNIIGFINYYDLYDRFEISYIEVQEEYRNKKIGSKMMNYLIDIGYKKNIVNITLEVNVENINAIKLYEKYNFQQVALRKKYYNGIDGYLMERKMM